MSTARKKEPDVKPVPSIIRDPNTGTTYTKGKFIGRGGFANVYELQDNKTKVIYAGKIVQKNKLVKPHQREKMFQEISIHRQLKHVHVVQFFTFFEDPDFIYLILELCPKKSLMELHKRRKVVTEAEARYYVRQIVEGCVYLHNTKVIHRDLKLGNLFIDYEMKVKIGDFGLATKLDHDDERKRTLCGTPNYIAPEVLDKNMCAGHSYEVDVWSLGCILYTLLVGTPPFETSKLKLTYQKIQKCEYQLPRERMSENAASLIQATLQAKPEDRPSMKKILEHPLFKEFIPAHLPASCLAVAPRFHACPDVSMIRVQAGSGSASSATRPPGAPAGTRPALKESTKQNLPPASAAPAAPLGAAVAVEEERQNINTLLKLTQQLTGNKRLVDVLDDSEEPSCTPLFWVSKWVDYSDKYGLGYMLSDNSVGVLFNDTSRLVMLSNYNDIQYINEEGQEFYCNVTTVPAVLEKKMVLLRYFKNYMVENLMKTGEGLEPKSGDELERLPFLRTWFRTKSAICLLLSNGTMQMNFFTDHTKLLLCPVMESVSYIDEQRVFRTFKFSLLHQHGVSRPLAERVGFAHSMLVKMITRPQDVWPVNTRLIFPPPSNK